jgi:chemotaxis signal transduction protein/chemotaxis regulatin CheY-phosphate phosphatase CheZ
MQQHIGFKLSENEYTIPILKVREIINTPTITGLPQSPAYMRGVINLRGRIIPIVDLRKLVSIGETDIQSSKVIVVSSGQVTFGILVDSITSVIKIDEAAIESPEGFMHEHVERVEGVAKVDDRLLIMLDTNKLVEMEDMSLFEEEVVEVGAADADGRVEVTRVVETMGGNIRFKEFDDAKVLLNRKLGQDAAKNRFLESMIRLLDCLASNDFEASEATIGELLQSAVGELYKEIGRVTRRLHDTVSEFRTIIDPRLKHLASDEVPNAVDGLQFVIQKTENATNRTMGIVEKYMSGLGELSGHLDRLRGPKTSVEYLKSFSRSLSGDLREIRVAQEFQDLNGQTIRKVIELVNSIEAELVRLIVTFGVKLDGRQEGEIEEKVSQKEVDDLLKEFGF